MIKKGKTILRGFTLIELMVVISIIAILAVGISNIDWNRLSDRQKVTIFKNRVVSDLETIRNNALFGKGVTNALIVPDSWKIDISTAGVSIYYEVGVGAPIFYKNLTLNSPEEIEAVYCGGTDLNASTASIIIEGADLRLDGTDCIGERTLSLDLRYKTFTESIQINTVSGLIGDRQ